MPDVDVTRLGQDRVPVDAGQTAPAGPRTPAFGGARASAAAHGPDVAVGQGYARVIPARVVHILDPRPGVVAPIEDAGQNHGVATSVHQHPTVREDGNSAAEHVVTRIVELQEL